MPRFVRTAALLAVLYGLHPMAVVGADDSNVESAGLELFQQRIMPIFRSPNPSSCVQCHLSSVDLKSYILPSHEQTFVSLRDQGLIDFQHPEKSKILTLIQMGEKDLDRGAKLIHEKTRRAEYEAFAAWIEACCGDPKLRQLPPLSDAELAKPERPDAIIRHNRKDRLLESFVRNVWSQRMRCVPCHTPFELDAGEAHHEKSRETHRQYEARFGQRMNIFKESPEATMQNLIARSRRSTPSRLPLINVDEPSKSLLVLKPTSKLPARGEDGQFERPSYAEPVSHMGGLKMFVDDQSYKAFLAWIQDYARVVNDQYVTSEDLPRDNWHPTKQVLRLTEAPESWPALIGVQMFVHAPNGQRTGWESEAIAFTQGPLTPRRMVNGTLFLLAASDESTASEASVPSLQAGKYLVKVYVDSEHRLKDDPSLLLGDSDFFGQVEIDARWLEGFPQAESISASMLQK